jgi:hypothetical protein
MSDATPDTTLTIAFTAAQMDAIDAWVTRHADPKPSREDAVRQLITGRLGADAEHPSTILPPFTTGRDIV